MAQSAIAHGEDPVRLRDAALHRISIARRWAIIGAAALTAGFAALVSALLPGKSLGAKSTTRVAASSTRAVTPPSVSPPLPAPASATQLGVGSPGQSQQSIPPPPAPPAPVAQPAPAESAPAAAAPAPASSAVSGGS